MTNLLKKFKPGVKNRTIRVIAALIWSVVGLGLMVRGVDFLPTAGSLWLVGAGILIGTGKSLLMLDKAAGKNSSRLSGLRNNACVGSVYSVKMWLLVVCMILLGRALQFSSLPREIVGVVYIAIGWGLFFSSRLLWKNIT